MIEERQICSEIYKYFFEKGDKGLYAVRIGDTHLYGTRHATEDQTYNLTVKNICGSDDYVISLAGAMKNLVMLGIEAQNGAKLLKDDRTK